MRRFAALTLSFALAAAALVVAGLTSPAGAIPPYPTITISPTSGPAGGDVTISGSCGVGGPPGPQSVHLVLLDPGGRTINVRTEHLGDNGFNGFAFSEALTVPPGARVGAHTATYVCTNAFSPKLPFPTFQVTSATATLKSATKLTATPAIVGADGSTTLAARVTVDGQPVTGGSVLFGFANHEAAVVPVGADGVATWSPDLANVPASALVQRVRATAIYQGTATNRISNVAAFVVRVRPAA